MKTHPPRGEPESEPESIHRHGEKTSHGEDTQMAENKRTTVVYDMYIMSIIW